jgi:hypothetical protein
MGSEEPKDIPEEIFIDDQVLDILRESLKMKIKEERSLPKKQQLVTALKDTLSEFMTCFRLVGYDLDGNSIQMTYSHNKLEKSALDDIFIESFGEFMSDKINRK